MLTVRSLVSEVGLELAAGEEAAEKVRERGDAPASIRQERRGG